jgi:hydrogenase maturation protease
MLTVIGLGNKLRGDDAIGPHIIEKLQSHEHAHALHLVDAGADAFTVLSHLVEGGNVLVIDSTRMGEKPGVVRKIKIDTDTIHLGEQNTGLHGFGLAEILHLAREINPGVMCTLIAIEPENIVFNSGLSSEVRKSVPIIIKLVVEELENHVKKENTDN